MMGAVLARALAAAATAWSVVYLVAYLWVIDAQDGAIAWWWVVLVVLAALNFALAAFCIWTRAALTMGLVTTALAMLVALLSLGALLAPTVVAAATALVVTRPGANASPATDESQSARQR
jgi:cytochrome bd-type quinol oxidase subunit 2